MLKKMKTNGKSIELSISDDPSLAEYEEARAELHNYMGENKEVVDRLRELAEQYNTALQNAEKVVRATATEHEVGVNCGPFKFRNFRETIDAEKLHELVGDEKFLSLGGAIETVPRYTIDKSLFKAKAAGKAVSEDIVKLVRTLTPVYASVEKVNIP